jgi:hypothetical protein
VVPAKGQSSAARRGEAMARRRAAWRRWPVGVVLQDAEENGGVRRGHGGRALRGG